MGSYAVRRRRTADAQICAVCRAVYREAVDRLPPLTRSVFLLHRVDELAYDEIGRRLKVPVAAVQNCLRDALVIIDEALD
ncbi:RNA polymerase sigma factor, partial [Novosphingobium sp. 11B]